MIWAALSAIHLQKRPGMRFNTYDDLFSIRKQEDETLQTLMNRVDTSIRRIQDLRPADFDLAKLDDPWQCSGHFLTSLATLLHHFC